MPSGSKKRKAAKKKKENQPNDHPNPFSVSSTHSNGGDDLKHKEDKESDVGEVSSPTSQDHHSYHNPSTKGEEEEFVEAGNIRNLPSIEELKVEVGEDSNIVVEEANVIRVEKELIIEDESDKKDGKFENDETDGGSSGSSSSGSNSSDDESHGIKSSRAVVDISPFVDPVKVADPVVENHTAVDLEKTSLSCERAEVDNNSKVESVFKVNGEDKVGISDVNEEEVIKSVETVATISEPKECVTRESDDHEKHSEVTELFVARAPHAVQTTSWKSCCGLFEAFAGSGR